MFYGAGFSFGYGLSAKFLEKKETKKPHTRKTREKIGAAGDPQKGARRSRGRYESAKQKNNCNGATATATATTTSTAQVKTNCLRVEVLLLASSVTMSGATGATQRQQNRKEGQKAGGYARAIAIVVAVVMACGMCHPNQTKPNRKTKKKSEQKTKSQAKRIELRIKGKTLAMYYI